MSQKFDNYYLGLDVGTNSVGWAVTDPEYHVLKSSGKLMWGIHLFDGGKTAKDRRTFRCARRRRERSVQRIAILQELLGDVICEVDPGFFARLKESALWQDDRAVNQKNTLFNDKNYQDSDYHREFKTGYHLRHALMNNQTRKFDIRLLYLGIAHILKNRGHFLFQGQNFELGGAFDTLYSEFHALMSEHLGIELPRNAPEFAEALKLKGMKRTSDAITNLWGTVECKKDKRMNEFAKLLAGQKVITRKLFDTSDEDEEWLKAIDESEVKDFQFSKADYDEVKLPLLEQLLGEKIETIHAAKALYDWSVLSVILGDSATLSEAMIQRHHEHVKQLCELKALIKKYDRKKYIDLFRNENNLTGYIAWIGKGKGKNNASRCSEDDFYKSIKTALEACQKKATPEDNEKCKRFLNGIEEKTLLQRQRVSTNGVIPYQLHLAELDKILDNAQTHYPFLAQKDETGFSVSDKIRSLLTFRIPYYVGPLSDKHKADNDAEHGHAWIVRHKSYEHTPIRPWNFEQVVDVDACAEAFIRRMTNKCTYLCDCDVLPKDSLLYSEFMVLNEINNIRLDNKLLPIEIKQRLFNEVYHQADTSKVKLKDIITAINSWTSQKYTHENISGIDTELKADLKSYRDFCRILGENAMKFDSTLAMVEDCILAIVLFGDEKEMLKRRIRKRYGAESERLRLTEDQIEQISKLKYRDWGRLSREFLTLESHDKRYGECRSIRNALYETQHNLMQLLSKSEYAYSDWIADYNREHAQNDGTFSYDNLVRPLYCSPAVKRSIWRALVIVKDILRVTKKAPARIFVEMAREEQEKKKTTSRKEKLDALYKDIKDNVSKADLEKLKEHLNSKSDDDLKRHKDKLYLYFTQFGKCMYSGESIRFEDLWNTNIYDIDHIYPQSLTMDNSLDNRVLVKKSLNELKTDKYPLPDNCKTKEAEKLWKFLKEKGLISDEKYSRLTRTTELTDEELAGFINRQLVETRQSSKAIIEALKSVFKDEKTEFVYARAKHVSEFRKKYEITKCRDLNDYHHAYDAYLNIVVGNIYYTKFTNSPLNFVKNAPKRSYNLVIEKLLSKNIERAGVCAWTADNQTSLTTVKKQLSNSRILFTRYAFEVSGGFYDQMPLKKGNGQIPLKSSHEKLHNIERYGGYNKDGGAYFILVEHKEKKKKVRSFEYVPIRLTKIIEAHPERLEQYCKDKAPYGLELVEPRILVRKVKFKSLICINGYPMHINGRASGGANLVCDSAVPLVLSYEDEKYLKNVLKFSESGGEDERISHEMNSKLYQIFLAKHSETIYKNRPANQIQTLKKGEEKFHNLGVKEQADALKNILNLFKCKNLAADLTLIGGSKNAGTTKISNKISNCDSALLIHQSPTGLTTQTIDLLKL